MNGLRLKRGRWHYWPLTQVRPQICPIIWRKPQKSTNKPNHSTNAMPNLPTSKVDHPETSRSALDDLRLHAERLALRAGIRPSATERGQEPGNRADAEAVQGSLKVKMTTDEAIAFADEWADGMTFHEGSQGWRVVCKLLADEVRRYRRGEIICRKCGLRQDGEQRQADF